ncbi:MAG: nucleotidyltransferase family protein [Bacteroidota bacterium]|nr:nucleotidyltransferase family protein [Bacteroidota bacterium]
MLNKLSQEDKFLISFSGINIKEVDFDLIKPNLDWDYILTNAYRNGIIPTLFNNISNFDNKEVIPVHVVSKLKNSYYANLKNNIKLIHEFKFVADVLKKENIDIILLKGIYLSSLVYKNIALRQIGDIDILLKENQIFTARKILLDSGYQEVGIPYTKWMLRNSDKIWRHIPELIKDDIVLDIHSHLLHNNPLTKEFTDLVWKTSLENTVEHQKVLTLNPELDILYLSYHLGSHLEMNQFQLRTYQDIAEIVRLYNKKINWDELINRAFYFKLNQIVGHVFYIINAYMNVSIPEHVLRRFNTGSQSKYNNSFITLLTCTDNPNNLQQISSFNKIRRKMKTISNIKGFSNKLHYIRGYLFPSIEYMSLYYNTTNRLKIFMYYFLRLLRLK